MEEEKVEVKETKNNNFNKLLFVIVGIALILVGLCFGYIVGRGATKENKKEEENTNKEDIKEDDEELLKELINIADLNNTNPPTELFTPLLFNDGVINDFDNETKLMVVYQYAIRNKKTTNVTGDMFDDCRDGSGSCVGIKIDDFKEIAKKYGIVDYKFEGKTYEDMYLFSYGGDVTGYESTSHDISSKKEGKDYIITDNIEFIASQVSSLPNRSITKEFTFKEKDNEYYLYSIKTIGEVEIDDDIIKLYNKYHEYKYSDENTMHVVGNSSFEATLIDIGLKKETYDLTKSNLIEPQFAYSIYENAINELEKYRIKDSYHDYMKKEEVNPIIKKYFDAFFGNVIEFKESYFSGCNYLNYNESEKIYYFQPECGGIRGDTYSAKINKVEKDENNLYIYETFLYNSYDGNDNIKLLKEIKFKWTFVKMQDNNYYLLKVEGIDVIDKSEKPKPSNLDFDFDKMENDLKNQIKNNNKNAYIVKCTDKITEDDPFGKEEEFIKLNEETIEVIINKLKTAKRYEIGTRGYLECPPHNIMYYIGGETYYNDKVFILDYDTNNTFAFGYDGEGYIFEFENDLTGFIESLETYKK